jgi:translation elongation factor EF-1beta
MPTLASFCNIVVQAMAEEEEAEALEDLLSEVEGVSNESAEKLSEKALSA